MLKSQQVVNGLKSDYNNKFFKALKSSNWKVVTEVLTKCPDRIIHWLSSIITSSNITQKEIFSIFLVCRVGEDSYYKAIELAQTVYSHQLNIFLTTKLKCQYAEKNLRLLAQCNDQIAQIMSSTRNNINSEITEVIKAPEVIEYSEDDEKMPKHIDVKSLRDIMKRRRDIIKQYVSEATLVDNGITNNISQIKPEPIPRNGISINDRVRHLLIDLGVSGLTEQELNQLNCEFILQKYKEKEKAILSNIIKPGSRGDNIAQQILIKIKNSKDALLEIYRYNKPNQSMLNSASTTTLYKPISSGSRPIIRLLKSKAEKLNIDNKSLDDTIAQPISEEQKKNSLILPSLSRFSRKGMTTTA